MHHARAPSKRMGKESVGAGVLNAQLSHSIILFHKERENAPPCAPLRSKEMKHFESGGPFRDCSNVIVFFGFEEARKRISLGVSPRAETQSLFTDCQIS
jgi:hypothetical protein